MILRSILYDVMLAIEEEKDLYTVLDAVQVMCTKDDIAAVEKEIAELNQKE